jgi:phosphotransferase system HPr (HPr) family protein
MTERTVTAVVQVVNPHGMHLRPADLFVRTAMKFGSKVWVTFEGQQVEGRSIVELLMLAARQGTQLTVTATGDDAEEAVAALVDLVQRGFDEMEEKGNDQ